MYIYNFYKNIFKSKNESEREIMFRERTSDNELRLSPVARQSYGWWKFKLIIGIQVMNVKDSWDIKMHTVTLIRDARGNDALWRLMSFRCLFGKIKIVSRVASGPGKEQEAKRIVCPPLLLLHLLYHHPYPAIGDKANYILIKVIDLAGSRRSRRQARLSLALR